jgi:hypothetical protein
VARGFSIHSDLCWLTSLLGWGQASNSNPSYGQGHREFHGQQLLRAAAISTYTLSSAK